MYPAEKNTHKISKSNQDQVKQYNKEHNKCFMYLFGSFRIHHEIYLSEWASVCVCV